MLICKSAVSCIIAVSLFLFSGCKSQVSRDVSVVFQDFYRSAVDVPIDYLVDSTVVQTHDIVADNVPVPQFFEYVARAYRISVIFDPSLANKSVTLNLYQSKLDTLLDAVSRLLSVSVVKIGDVFYIGTIKPEDRAFFVRVVPRLSKQEIESLFTSILGDAGRYVVYPDGLVIVVDVQAVLQRVSDMLDLVSKVPNDSWVIQLFIFNFRGSAGETLGLDSNFAGDLSFKLLRESGSPLNTHFSGAGLLSGLFQAEKQSSDISLLSQPLFVLLDGGEASFVYGDRVPVPKKSVSNEGTVTTSGYEYIQTGLNYSVTIRQLNEDMAKLGLNLSLSSVVGYVGEAPITDQQDFMTSANISSGGVYLLGSVQRDVKKSQISGLLPLWFSGDKSSSEIQIWARVYKISGSALAD